MTPQSTPARVLGVAELAFAAFNCVVGAGIFGLPALAAASLGAAAILGYIVCTIVLALVGLCLAEVGSRVSDSGGPIAYASAAYGPIAGGVIGTLMWMGGITGSAAVANLWVDTLTASWPAMQSALVRGALLVALYSLLAFINVRGTKLGSRVSIVMAIVKLVPLLLLIGVGAFHVVPANLQWTHSPSLPEIGDVTILLFFAFLGIESGLYASAEVRNPVKTVPRALLLAAVVVSALYIGLQVVSQGVLGPLLPKSSSPLVTLGGVLMGSWGALLLGAGIIVSTFGYLVADALCSPRAIFALGERRQLPAFFAALHSRYGTPARAVCIYLGLCLIIALTGTFRVLAVLTSAASLVLFAVCCTAVLRLRSQGIEQAGTPFRIPGGPVVPVAATVLIVWLLMSMARRELLAILIPIGISGLIYAVRSRPSSVLR